MALNPKILVAKIQAAQLQPPPAAKELEAYCVGFVSAMTAGSVSHALVSGTTAPGAPLLAGAAAGGIMVLTATPWVASSGAVGPLASSEHTAVINYVSTGTVAFATGTITGTCTNSPSSPGPLTLGAGKGGKIVGLTGAACATAVSSATGGSLFGPDSAAIYNVLMEYLLLEAEVTYLEGSVTGVCPPGGGPLGGGLASGGIIL